jgi:hypothetical protein
LNLISQRLKSLKERKLDVFNSNLVSVDLSNATDRLPVQIQADILTLLGVDGELWKELLRRPYYVSELDRTVVYSVGQPMGAYSSFVMLSLTNHVLNVMAILRCHNTYIPGSGQYAVLGDDDASTIPQVAEEYRKLLISLGVEVNPIKGFNGNIIEFAKRIYFKIEGSLIELSPLGYKSLMQALRNPFYIISVLLDMSKKGFLYTNVLLMVNSLLEKMFHKGRSSLISYLFVILGPQGGLWPLLGKLNPDSASHMNLIRNFESVKES